MFSDISGLDTALIAIAAVIIALNQGLRDADYVRKALPNWLKSPRWNYVPAVLVGVAAVVFVYGRVIPHSPPPPDPKLEAEVDTLRETLGDILGERAFRIPDGFSKAGSTVRFVHAPVAYMTSADPAKDPRAALAILLDQNAENPAVRGILKGTFFAIPAGYPFAGEAAAVTPLRLTTMNQRSGPCVKLRHVKKYSSDETSCIGHPMDIDADNVEELERKHATAN